MDHCAPSEFWERWNSDGLHSVCVNNKQAWFCACLYKLVHSSFGTSKTPAYPFEAKTVSFVFWLSFRWQVCKSNRFCALPSFPSSPPLCSHFNTSLSSVISKLVESSYSNYPMTGEDIGREERTRSSRGKMSLPNEMSEVDWGCGLFALRTRFFLFFPFLLPFLLGSHIYFSNV